jgi:DNA-binding NarL/FixJ family response regulator
MSVNAARPLRVVVADDEADIRRLVRLALEADGRFVVVGEADNGGDVASVSGLLQPDIVLLDLSMPLLGGIDAIPGIRDVSPHTRIVVFSGLDPFIAGAEALSRGADAYVDKAVSLQRLPDTLAGAAASDPDRPESPPPPREATSRSA